MTTFVFNPRGTLLVVEEIEALGPIRSDPRTGCVFDIHMKSGTVFCASVETLTTSGSPTLVRLLAMRNNLITLLNKEA